MPEPVLSVVMPCYNESATVLEACKRVLASPYTRQLVVVDDASVDDSAGLVESIGDDRVLLVRQPRNRGKGAALRRGFELASGPFVVVQDADLEYDPADFEQLVGPLIDGSADVVFGSRFMSGQ
ncbi:MAG: glycosyltransferase family 2 protein, partial [Acidimicrobiia bacterium]